MKKAIKVITILVVLFFTTNITKAQFGGPGDGGGIPGGGGAGGGVPGSGAEVPFDGGLSIILLAVGAGIVKKRST